MKRKREEHNGCGGGTPGSQKTRRTAPPDAYKEINSGIQKHPPLKRQRDTNFHIRISWGSEAIDPIYLYQLLNSQFLLEDVRLPVKTFVPDSGRKVKTKNLE